MTDEEQLWICHYDAVKKKKHLNVAAIKEQIIKKLDVHLEDSWLKYLLQLMKVDDTSAFFNV